MIYGVIYYRTFLNIMCVCAIRIFTRRRLLALNLALLHGF